MTRSPGLPAQAPAKHGRRHRGSMQAHHRRQTRYHRSQMGARRRQAVLTLPAVISNGDFEEYWRFHLAREHQRLYPGTAQGRYTLGA
jgi:hypothetical protein